MCGAGCATAESGRNEVEIGVIATAKEGLLIQLLTTSQIDLAIR